MWIRAPFIAILKKHRVDTVKILILASFALLFTACVVTDEIEFQDKLNYPPQFVSADPSNDAINYAKNSAKTEFTVHIWDPDEDDIALYEGQITIIEQLNSLEGQVKVSQDAGDYLCNFIYYKSLELAAARKTSVLFVHIPSFKEISLVQQKVFLSELIEAISKLKY